MEQVQFIKSSAIFAAASLFYLCFSLVEPFILGGYVLGVITGGAILFEGAKRPLKAFLVMLAFTVPLVTARIVVFPSVGAADDFMSYKNAMYLLSIVYHCLVASVVKDFFARQKDNGV
jgi:hypothetical protein